MISRPEPADSNPRPAQVSITGRPAAGLALVILAAVLLAALMVWQAWHDFTLVRSQHQTQIEESVWLTAEQVGRNLELKSVAIEQLLATQQDSAAAPPMQLINGLEEVIRVDLSEADAVHPDQPWMRVVHRLALSEQTYTVAADPVTGLLHWIVASRNPGEYWVLLVSEQAIAELVSAYPSRGYTWLLEDTASVRVLARQRTDHLIFLENAQMTREERQRVYVSAPVEGTLWQVRGLVDEGYYRQQLGQLISAKALVVAAFTAVLLLILWVLSQMQRTNRSLEAFNAESYRTLQQAERRYRDIFQNVDMALVQLDLAGLLGFLEQQHLASSEELDVWLKHNPQRHDELMGQIRVIDANQNMLDLLELDSVAALQQAVQHNRKQRIERSGFRYGLVAALVNRQTRFEMETPLRSVGGILRYVWIVMRLPPQIEELNAVTVSIADITERRRIETTMSEREDFWAGVVKAVPDIVYIKDVQHNQVVFANRSLARSLGYSRQEEAAFPADPQQTLLHPDDVEYMQINRNLQQVLPDEKILDWRIRWRRRDGGWNWFALRVKVMSRLPDGRVHQVIGTVKDVTHQTGITESLKTSEQRYRLLAENISDVIWSTDMDFRLDYVSPSVIGVLGFSPEFIITNGFEEVVAGKRFTQFITALVREIRPQLADPAAAERLRHEGFNRHTSFDCIKADGHTCPVELRVSLMWSPYGRFLGLLGIARDITEQRRTENRLRMAATVFENTTGAIVVTDPAGYIVQINENFSRITGYTPDEVLDQLPLLLASDYHKPAFYQELRAELRANGRWEGEIWQKRRNGEDYPTWAGISAVLDSDGDMVSYIGFFVDISERKASEARIESLAYFDALTGLPNRTLFQDRLAGALQVAERRKEWVAVLFLDLDRFKPINDTLGHAAGDTMLKEVGRRLRSCIRESDTVARMGGDEFTMLLIGLQTRDAALKASIHVAEKVLRALAPGFLLQQKEFFISASIGIALYPQDGVETTVLLKNADTAMYHAKEMGKDTFRFYQAEMNARAAERLNLENDLRRALHNDEFTLDYQPQFSCSDRHLTGAEALLRWSHPELGNVSPAVFIPIAEEIGLVSALGDWVLDRACRQMASWHDAGHLLPRLAINLSARQFSAGRLAEQVAEVISRYRLEPGCIELELTESILLQDVEDTMRTLASLKELGVQIAIDDFGTGYSSLKYLKDFPIDTLKIDRSFIHAMYEGSRDASLVQAIVAMGRSLKLRVVAEGVEGPEQLSLLRNFDCDEAQGFNLGRPVPADELLETWLQGT
ncbi:EAL domain-containing protein [Pseudomonas sp. OIL-1]|uniref:EAL domain-containing protein n=1 Tax=Pseudomonas sp. OIL-1 TaxID=2706126 RepID=UPI0013A7169F|nr:EAL domain-containing protein [Pseudomonas sp. OIL-1]QIB53015.1 EAL domain-containing protein [Pseudomonas sp. OIL-1]